MFLGKQTHLVVISDPRRPGADVAGEEVCATAGRGAEEPAEAAQGAILIRRPQNDPPLSSFNI